jgi:hypothetical protein
VLGAAIGWAVSLDLDWSAAAGQRECVGQSGLCIGIAAPAGLLAGLVTVVAACWIGFAAAGVRPLYVTVPAGVVAVLLSVVVYSGSVAGGRLHPGWLFALVNGAVFAVLAAPAQLLKQRPRSSAPG